MVSSARRTTSGTRRADMHRAFSKQCQIKTPHPSHRRSRHARSCARREPPRNGYVLLLGANPPWRASSGADSPAWVGWSVRMCQMPACPALGFRPAPRRRPPQVSGTGRSSCLGRRRAILIWHCSAWTGEMLRSRGAGSSRHAVTCRRRRPSGEGSGATRGPSPLSSPRFAGRGQTASGHRSQLPRRRSRQTIKFTVARL